MNVNNKLAALRRRLDFWSNRCRNNASFIVLESNSTFQEVDMYVDGFVLAVPKNNLDAYKELATLAGKIWKEYGALDFVECVGDDVPYGELTSFPRAVQAKDDEIVVFSWITYESREKRDEVNAKVMADERLKGMTEAPFDGKRMIFGGFKPLVQM